MQVDVRDVGSIPGLGRSPGGGYVTHSSILVWRIPWTEKPCGLQLMGLQRVGHNRSNLACTHIVLAPMVVTHILLSSLPLFDHFTNPQILDRFRHRVTSSLPPTVG